MLANDIRILQSFIHQNFVIYGTVSIIVKALTYLQGYLMFINVTPL